MTDIRVTATSAAYDWDYCPRCGKRLALEQLPDGLVRNSAEDGWDVEASNDNGYDFNRMVKSCGSHIKLWVPEYDSDTELDA